MDCTACVGDRPGKRHNGSRPDAAVPLPCVSGPIISCSRNLIVEEDHKYRSILLFGMPGSGKGTQGAVLGQLPSLVHISMGDIFRKIPRTGKFGREIEKYTSQGLMVPDDLTVRIFERHLMILEMQELLVPEQHTLILDGLPRSYAQAERLDSHSRRDPDLPPEDHRHRAWRRNG